MEPINNHEVRDDKVEFLMQLWKEKLKHISEEKLRQNVAIPLAEDISNYVFDFASNESKYEVLGNKCADIVNDRKDDEIPAVVDVYYIQENLMRMFDMESREKEAFSMVFQIDNENTRDVSLLNEFLAGRYIMRNLSDLDQSLIEKIFSDLNYKNVRKFMNDVIKHQAFPIEIGDNLDITGFIIHKCVEEKLIFLLDILLEKIKFAESQKIKEILKHTDGAGNNIFHIACELRIKFVIEELWNLIQKAFGEGTKELTDYLLITNSDGLNGFQLAFDMPLQYNTSDYANEVKNKETLFHYYRNRGPIELEMYNFESCLNFLYDIGRRNIPDKHKRSLILNKASAMRKRSYYHDYVYSIEFSGFRHDFLQLRYYCITKLGAMKTDDLQKTTHIYQFLSHYVEKFMSKLDENKLLELYTKLSYDTFMGDFFKILLKNYFSQALNKIRQIDNLKSLYEITTKTLGEREFHNVLMTKGLNGNNALHWAINTSDYEIFQLTFGQIKQKSEVKKWILLKNMDRYNTLYLILANKEAYMLQSLLEYFGNNLTEEEIFEIFEQSTKKNYKFFDICVQLYNQNVFNLIWSFIDAHISRENQRALVGEQIVMLATSRWQENATCSVLDLIASLFDENEIKKFLEYKNHEGQTPFHTASMRSNISHLQLLCKFSHAFLNQDDFLSLISLVDANESSM